MDEKMYLQDRTEYLLQKAIDTEIETLKDTQKYDPSAKIDKFCTEIGILVALKRQAKELIESL